MAEQISGTSQGPDGLVHDPPASLAVLLTTERKAPNWLAQVGWILYKDLLIEWRSKVRLNVLLLFGTLSLLLFSFAVGPEQRLQARLAPGFLWLALLMASILGLSESFRLEEEENALEGLRLLPVAGSALFLGKALANSLILFALGSVLLPVSAALYGVSLQAGAWYAWLGILWLGAMALAGPGTIFAAITAVARARELLLPLLLFPILVPGILGIVKATTLLLHGDPMGALGSWLALLVAFNLMYWGLGLALFARVVEA